MVGSGVNPSTYKSRLQELCHAKKWRLPEYQTKRDGPDHSPHFQATVTVGGLSFDGPSSCSSSKDARGHAAMLAFHHFSSSTPPPSPPSSLSDSRSAGRSQSDDLSTIRDDALGRSPENSDAPVSQTSAKNGSMYKSKLQELCQKKLWQFPKYEVTKDGPDHMPHFQASISVCGLSFTSLSTCRTSKEAQSEVARIAFNHFSGAVGPSSLVNSTDSSNLANALASGIEGLKTNPDDARDSTKQWLEQADISDCGIPWKNQLQNYAQRRKFNLPSYDHVRESSFGRFRYKAKVSIADQTFEAEDFFSSLKHAENASARLALASMLEEGNQEDNPIFYKNLLLELIQKEGLSPAVYVTVSDGPSNLPPFTSTVEVEGKKFKGVAAKTKKQAEQHASKIAWTALKERKDRRHGHLLPCNLEVHKGFELSPPGAFARAVDMQKPQPPSIEDEGHRSSSACMPMHVDEALMLQKPSQVAMSTIEDSDIFQSSSSAQSKVELKPEQRSDCRRTPALSVAMSTMKNPDVCQSSSSSAQVELELKPEQRPDGSRPALSLSEHWKPAGEEAPMPSSKEVSGCAADLAGDTSLGRDGSSQSCIRIQVHPWRPDLEIPKGMKLLPMSDDKWVAMMANPAAT